MPVTRFSFLRRIALFTLVPLLALVALSSWALASPPGGSPDDDFHLASIWCGLGERPGLCEQGSDPLERAIPEQIATISECFAFDAEVSAACEAHYAGGGPLVDDLRGNFQGQYPPVYYGISAVFASTDIPSSVLAMRIFVSTVFVALFTATFLLLPVQRRSGFGLAALITVVPLGMFIIASNNPSGWALLSAFTVWSSLVGYFESSGKRRIGLAVVTIVAVVLGAGSRGDSAIYAVLGAGVAVVLSFDKTRAFLVSLWLPAVACLIAVLFYLSSNQVAQASNGLITTVVEPNPLALLINNFIDLPMLWAGAFGSGALGALGWFDTPMPGVVGILSLAAFAAVIFTGVRSLNWRKSVALAVVATALVAIPLYVLYQSNVAVGSQVQPRYILPMLIILAGVALFEVNGQVIRLTSLQLWLVIASLFVANALALHATLRRFISGVDVGSLNLNADIEWWWVGAPSPMVVWLIGSLAFGLTIAGLGVAMSRRIAPGMTQQPLDV